MRNDSILRLDKRLDAILHDAMQEHQLHSIVLADESGLTITHAGQVEFAGVSAIAPELIRVGEKATSLGSYDSMSCVIVMLENSHLLIIKTMTIHGQRFVLIMDAPLAPKGLGEMLKGLKRDISDAMKVEEDKEGE